MAFVIETKPSERLATLWELHHERLYRLARRLAPSLEDALDLVQETFLRAARRPDSIPEGQSQEAAWLVRVLVNIRRDQWHKVSAHSRRSTEALPYVAVRDPETACIAKAAVWQALDILPPRRRAVVVLHEIEGLTIPAIASLLGISAITVRWRLGIGRRSLQLLLGDFR